MVLSLKNNSDGRMYMVVKLPVLLLLPGAVLAKAMISTDGFSMDGPR
jgi:hypothetical protein